MKSHRLAGLVAAALVAVLVAGLGTALPASAEPGLGPVTVVPGVLGVPTGIDAPYEAVSCAPAGGPCVAVGPGPFSDGPSLPGGGRPTALSSGVRTAAGRTWGAPVPLALPAGDGDTDAVVGGVSCPVAGGCEAVGSYLGPQADTPLAFAQVGGSWQRGVAVGLPAAARFGGELTSVWCAAQGSCTAAGWYPRDAADTVAGAMVAVEDAGTWSAATSLPPPPGDVAFEQVLGLGCADASDCTVLGLAERDGIPVTVAWTAHAGTFSAPVVLASPPGTFFLALSVACGGVGDCVAVGALGGEEPSPQPAAAVLVDGRWAAPTRLRLPRLSPLDGEGLLLSVSCGTPTQCVAVGQLMNGASPTSATTAAAATLTFGATTTWSTMDELHAPTVRPDTSVLWALSCVDPGEGAADGCVAVGSDAIGPPRAARYRDFATAVQPARVPTRPQPPERVAVTPRGSAAVVAWQPPPDDGGAPVASYAVTASPGTSRCTTTRDHCELRGLRVGVRYAIAVTDRTSAGTSVPRHAHDVVAGWPPRAPAALAARPEGDALLVRWSAPAARAGQGATTYAIEVLRDGAVLATYGTAATRCATRSLHAGTYVVQVVARDASGASPPARVVVTVP